MTVGPAEPDRPAYQPSIAPDIRASDAEREAIVSRLSDNAAAGRLTLGELEERIRLAYQATTRAELTALVTDLPEAVSATGTSRRRPTRWIVSVMGGVEKTGRWRVADRLSAIAVMGGNDVDLRGAEIDGDEVTIVAIAVMGGMDIYVPDTVDVDVGGFAFMGGRGEKGSTRLPRPGAPRVRILAFALMGGIDVWRLPEEAVGVPLQEAKRLAGGTR